MPLLHRDGYIYIYIKESADFVNVDSLTQGRPVILPHVGVGNSNTFTHIVHPPSFLWQGYGQWQRE